MATTPLKPIPTSGKYFPEIDGIKFFTTLAVVWSHGEAYFWGMTNGQFIPAKRHWALLFNIINNAGVRGMELFFVLSGFLLSLPFARHYLHGAPRVSLRYYYLRRLTRIEPPYLIAMVLALLLSLANHALPLWTALKSFAASMLYCHEIVFGQHSLLNSVTWSLEVEVQFYLIAPLLFFIFRLSPRLRRGVLTGGIIILAAMVHRWLPPHITTIYSYSYFFLAGMLLTDVFLSLKKRKIHTAILLPAGIVCAAMIWMLPAQRLLWARLVLPFSMIGFCFCVLNAAPLQKIFRYRWIPVIGGMSYSIYLLHHLAILKLGRYFVPLLQGQSFVVQWWTQMLLYLILTMAVALPFCFLVERPFMRWRPGLLKSKINRDR